MKTTLLPLLSLLVSLSAFGQTVIPGTVTVTGSPTGPHDAAIVAAPHDGKAVAIVGRSILNSGVVGHSSQWSGVFGSTNTGTGGDFTTYGLGTALRAVVSDFAPPGAVALDVRGPVRINRNARTRLRVYDPNSGALVGEFEFEVVAAP